MLRGIGDGLFKRLEFKSHALQRIPSLSSVLLRDWNPPYTTAEPEVVQHSLRGDERFLLLSSDGLFDWFSSEQAVSFVGSALDQSTVTGTDDGLLLAATVAQDLIMHSLRAVATQCLPPADSEEQPLKKLWQVSQQSPGMLRRVMDDITVVILILQPPMSTAHDTRSRL